MVISDGELNEEELKRSGKNKAWLEKKLKEQGAEKFKDVFIASVDAEGELFVQKKESL